MKKIAPRRHKLREEKKSIVNGAASKRVYAKGLEYLESKVDELKERERKHIAESKALFTDTINSLIEAQRQLVIAAEAEASRKVRHRALVKQAGDVAFIRNGMALSFAFSEMLESPIIKSFLRGNGHRTLPNKYFMAKVMTLLYMDTYVLTSQIRLKAFLGYKPRAVRSIISSLYQAGYIESLDKKTKNRRVFMLTELATPVVDEINRILNNYTNASRQVAFLPVVMEHNLIGNASVGEDVRDTLHKRLDDLSERYKEYNKVAADVMKEINEEDAAATNNDGTSSLPLIGEGNGV